MLMVDHCGEHENYVEFEFFSHGRHLTLHIAFGTFTADLDTFLMLAYRLLVQEQQ